MLRERSPVVYRPDGTSRAMARDCYERRRVADDAHSRLVHGDDQIGLCLSEIEPGPVAPTLFRLQAVLKTTSVFVYPAGKTRAVVVLSRA